MNHNRDITLDITKGFGIIFMVLGHMHFSDAVFNKYIYAFHMPLFFIVSGMLFKENRTIKNAIVSRSQSLLIPYLTFGGGYCLISIVKSIYNHDYEAIMPVLKIMFLFPTENFPYESALWFLPVMFLTSIGYAFVRKHISLRWVSIIVVAIGILGFSFPMITESRLPWGIDTFCVAMLFFHVGYLIKCGFLIDRIREYRTNKPSVFCLIFFVIVATNSLLIHLNESVNLRVLHYGNPVLTFINAVVGTMTWITIADILNSSERMVKIKQLICRISELSIAFLCINHISLRIIGGIVRKIFGSLNVDAPIPYLIVQFVLAMVLMLLVGKLINESSLRVIIGRKKVYAQ